MLRSTSTWVRYTCTCDEEEPDGGTDVTRLDDHQSQVLGAARPRRESTGNARLLVRATARVPPERQARHRRRRDGEETPPASDHAARAERRQARDAGPASRRRRPRGSGAAGARAQVGAPAAAAGPRYPGAAARGSAAEADGERAAAVGANRAVPLAEGSDQGAILRRRGAG